MSASAATRFDDAPQTEKRLTDNNDGSYQLSLSVTGKSEESTTTTKANVVIVLDTSGSMKNNVQGGGTRLSVAKNAVNKLSKTLLDTNTAENPDMVELSLVTFATTAQIKINKTTNLNTVQNTVNALSADGGTNWEDALQKANGINFGDSDPTYVIFVSDGNPTFYLNPNGSVGGNGGEGASNIAASYNHAVDDAQAIVAAGKDFYGIGVFGSVSRMQSLVTDAGAPATNYFSATDEAAINAAFSNIAQSITNGLGYTNVKITDQLTNLTSSTLIDGTANNFKYTKTDSNGVTTTWTGAPAASFSGQEVNWDLGSLILEHNTTYAVEFTVWPSQASLDLVADLTNGLRDYDGLTEEEKAQIVKDADGNYRLNTNTNDTRVAYSTIETVNGVPGAPSAIKTAPIENPDPIAIGIANLDLKKIWLDGLDASQREDIGGSIRLNLQKDGVDYLTNLELNEDNHWVYDDEIAIAPGIMVSSGPAFDSDNAVSFNGQNYTILEPGHDYRLTEEDVNEHYEFEDNLYHPMWVNNVLMNILLDAGGAIASMTPLTEISATNTLKGGINIEKVVLDQNGEKINSTEKFIAHVELKNPDGSNYEYSYRIYYGENNPEFNPDFAFGDKENRSEKITGTAPVDVELYVGDQIRFVNVDTGVVYSVSETNLPFGYTLSNIIYEQSYGSADDYEPTAPNPTNQYIVSGNTAHRATIVNTYHSGELEIAKSVEVESGDVMLAISKSFVFTVKLSDDEGNALPNKYHYQIIDNGTLVGSGEIESGGTVSLKDRQRAIILNLPAGANYEVSEESLAGFSASATGEKGAIVEGQNQIAEFINTYSASGTFDLEVTKVLKGRNWLSSDVFSFNLVNTDSDPEIIVDSLDVNTQNKTAKFQNITIKNPGTYHYTIYETPVTMGGFADDTGATPLKFIVTATDNGEGVIETSVVAENGEVTNSGTITNTYTATGSIILAASKILDGRDWLEGESFTFSMFDEDGNLIGTSKTVTKENQNYIEFDKIEYKTNPDDTGASKTYVYFIRETSELPAGITNSGEAEVAVIVEDLGNGELRATADYGPNSQIATITNTYSTKATEASIKIHKDINDLSNSNKNGKFSFKLICGSGQDESCEDQEIEIETEDLSGDAEFGLSFDKAGSYKYEIYEVEGDVSGFSYDKNAYEVIVVVTDDPEIAELSATVYVGGEETDTVYFVNEYKAAPTRLELLLEKELSGLNPGVNPATFTFNLSGDASQSQSISGSGQATFLLEYDKVGTYYYEISEQNDAAPGYSYDEKIYDLRVEVTDEDGQLVATAYLDDEAADEGVYILFANSYQTSDAVLQLYGQKILTGRALRAGEFSFSVYLDGTLVATGTNDANGNVAFSEIRFDKPGSYELKITEDKNSALSNITFDEKEYVILVEVTDDGEGALHAEIVEGGERFYTFTNSYKEPTVPSNPHTDDRLGTSIALMLISLLGLLGTAVSIRRKLAKADA